jgi:hypothetical protein
MLATAREMTVCAGAGHLFISHRLSVGQSETQVEVIPLHLLACQVHTSCVPMICLYLTSRWATSVCVCVCIVTVIRYIVWPSTHVVGTRSQWQFKYLPNTNIFQVNQSWKQFFFSWLLVQSTFIVWFAQYTSHGNAVLCRYLFIQSNPVITTSVYTTPRL